MSLSYSEKLSRLAVRLKDPEWRRYAGLLFGGVFSLMAVGLTLIFGVMRVINFAHGEFLMLGMFGAWWLSDAAGLDPLLSIVPLGLAMYGFGVLVYVHQGGVVQQGMVAFRDGFELGHQVGELRDVPSADITENPLAFLAPFARSLPVFMRVIVMARGGMAKPGKPRQSLTLG